MNKRKKRRGIKVQGYASGEQRIYTYDSLDRLTGETHLDSSDAVIYSATYEYDLAGNRTQSVVNGATNTYTLGLGNRLAAWGVDAENTQTYDTAGNVIQITDASGTRSLSWDIQYQLKGVAINGTLAESYGYDPLGRRAWTFDGSVTNWHVYDGMHCVADVDHDGTVLRSYTYGPGIDNLLAITDHSTTETNTYYAITDHLGTVHALADESGSIVESYRYDAWGRVLEVRDANGLMSKVNGLWSSPIGNRYLFQGREYSWATGLYNFRARWYDPATGRWLSKDPIGISGGLNQYVAFGNNPVLFVDPLGLDFIYIVDANAVNRQGHAAVITGPINGQWRYDSFGKPKGAHRHGQYSFASEQDALNFARQHGYTHFARWQTSPAQDAAAQARADQWHTGAGQNYTTHRQYEVDGDNCQAMVDDAADAANLETYIRRAGIRHPNVTMRYTRHGADRYGLLR